MTAPSPGGLLAQWSFDPPLASTLLALAASYGLAARRRRGWPRRRTASFLTGLIVIAIALMSGVDRWSERMLSVHMTQHLLLVLAAPALLVYGAPVRLALGTLPRGARRALGATLSGRLGRTLSRPGAGFALFAGVMLVTHLSGLFELALRDEAVHVLEHGAYLGAGVLLLSPLIAADPLPHPPSPLTRFCWMMGAMTAMAVPGALLTFAPAVRYPYYIAQGRAIGISALADQQLAGAIMWVAGSIALFVLALWVVVTALLGEERRQRRRELYRNDETELSGASGAIGALGR